jgi:hypothetical protein
LVSRSNLNDDDPRWLKLIDGRCSSGCFSAFCDYQVSLGDQPAVLFEGRAREDGISSPDGSWCSEVIPARALSSVSLSSVSGDEAPVLFDKETQDDSISSPDGCETSWRPLVLCLYLAMKTGFEN